MPAKVIGAKKLHRALVDLQSNIGNRRLVTKRLDAGMNKYAHVITGYMKSTIYYTNLIAGADASYAGFEADRGGDHDFAQLAIDNFPVEDYFDEIVRPF